MCHFDRQDIDSAWSVVSCPSSHLQTTAICYYSHGKGIENHTVVKTNLRKTIDHKLILILHICQTLMEKPTHNNSYCEWESSMQLRVLNIQKKHTNIPKNQ